MRRDLVPLLGKPVMVSGHVSSKRKAEDNVHRMCISKCEIRLWDEHKSYKQNLRSPVTAVADHLWNIHDVNKLRQNYPTFAKNGTDGIALYSKGTVYGFIQRYKRSNGTDDIGLRPVPICSPRLILQDHLPQLVQAGQWQLLIDTITDIYNSGAGIFLSSSSTKKSPAELRKEVLTYRREAERHLKALEAIDPQPFLSALAPNRLVSRTAEELLADISLPDSKAADGPGKSFPWALPT